MVFGRVVSGVDYVTEVENQKVDANHRPYADVRVSNCGELVLMKSKSVHAQCIGMQQIAASLANWQTAECLQSIYMCTYVID